MAAKKKCKHCGKYDYEFVRYPTGTFCNNEHAILFANAKVEKIRARNEKKRAIEVRRSDAELKRKFRLADVKTRQRMAKIACHAYIRERDKGKPCICCGRPYKDSFHAGHWWESGNFSFIRYHEDNIHSQSMYCNIYKGGDSGDYEKNLIKKIGIDRVNWLRDNRSNPVKRTATDYLEIEKHFKMKLKIINDR